MSAADFARRAVGAGLSVIPVTPGDKKPPFEWKKWQSEIMSLDDIESFFTGKELGIICGQVSGGVECLDFDDPKAFDEWKALVIEYGYEDELNTSYIQKTPSGGWHVVYRTKNAEGNQKLAKGQYKSDPVRIETRGEGGYFKCYPSKGYEAKNKNLLDLPTLSDDTHELFLNTARFLTKAVIQRECGTAIPGADPRSPGMEFVKRATWEEILEPHGWTRVFKRGEVGYWQRPGKKGKDVSATTGHGGLDYFWCFTTSTEFDNERAYNKFAVYAFLNHGGNFSEAARQLARDGYGSQDRAPKAYSTPEPPQKPSSFQIETLGNVAATTPQFLWEPYLRLGTINLLDAKGGSGKTTFSILLAALGSIGRLPYGIECEPFDTLYFGYEDDTGELRTLFDNIGGDPTRVHVVNTHFRLDAVGLKNVESAITQTKSKLVVFDALKYYMSGTVRNQLDDMELAPHFANLKALAGRTGACFLNIRHWAKQVDLMNLAHAGQGNEQWRNSHRSQIVMLRHPELYGTTIGVHTKSNLLTPEGPPFAIQQKDGQYLWVPTDQLDLSFLGDKSSNNGGVKQQAATEWLKSFLNGKANESLSNIREASNKAGIKTPQLYTAKKELGIIDTKDGRLVYWRLEDPFGDL